MTARKIRREFTQIWIVLMFLLAFAVLISIANSENSHRISYLSQANYQKSEQIESMKNTIVMLLKETYGQKSNASSKLKWFESDDEGKNSYETCKETCIFTYSGNRKRIQKCYDLCCKLNEYDCMNGDERDV